jgi:alpha-soluble NSF attachment protein
MGDYTNKGKALLEKADKKLSSWSMFGNKYEDAAELIEKACNQFKLGKSCKLSFLRRLCYLKNMFKTTF